MNHDDINIGPTGQFPYGRVDDRDLGELRVAMSIHKGKVIIDFGTTLSFVALTPDQAEETALALLRHAATIRGVELVVKLVDLPGDSP